MIYRILAAAALVAMATITQASEAVDKAIVEKLKATLEVPSTGLKVGSVSHSTMPGIYEVQFANGPLVYASADGQYFIVGDLFSVGPAGYTNLAEKRRDADRLERLAGLNEDEMIVFSPAGEQRGQITVFTDVTCFYCQKLHKEVPELNRRGIEVRYLAYPRGGVGSDGYRKLASAWCAANPQETLTKLKARQSVEDNVCPGNPIAKQYDLGTQMGVRGTPAIITDSGQMIPGYQSADELMVTMGLN
jgi:thiol:disulfide interchange protein DsbC